MEGGHFGVDGVVWGGVTCGEEGGVGGVDRGVGDAAPPAGVEGRGLQEEGEASLYRSELDGFSTVWKKNEYIILLCFENE